MPWGAKSLITKRSRRMDKVTVLYPGGFKPAHGGHIDLIKKYAELPEVKEVWVLVGPGVRDGIIQSKAVEMLEKLTEDIKKAVVQGVPWPSPVLAAYKIVQEADKGAYTLAASSKEAENAKRITDFAWKHSPEGKFYREGIDIVELSVDIEPLRFRGRTDEHEGEPISASVLRQDLINGDLENFMTGYPDSTEDQVSFIWDTLEQNVSLPESDEVTNIDEALHTSGTPTESSPSAYDRYQAGYNYKSQFPIMEEDDDEEPLKDWEWNETKKTWTRKK
jgi:hypothetical protein